MKKIPRSKKVLEYALVSISALSARVILMSTPGPFPLKGDLTKCFLTCVADLGGTSWPDLELDNFSFATLMTLEEGINQKQETF